MLLIIRKIDRETVTISKVVYLIGQPINKPYKAITSESGRQ